MEDITALIQNLLSGSEKDWHAFVDNYGRYVWHCILRVTRKYGCQLSREDEQDLYQDVFAVLIEKGLRNFRGCHKPHLLAYIHRITIHHTINYLKRRKKNISMEQCNIYGEGYVLLLQDLKFPRPDEEIMLREKIELLKDQLTALKQDKKRLLEMFYLEGISPQEIAKSYSITTANFYVRKKRVLNQLRNNILHIQIRQMRAGVEYEEKNICEK